MSEFHQIGELLQAGAKPSQEEVEQLSELGAFVSAMYGRYLHGTKGTESLTAHTDSFASSIGGRLGAETGTRWEHGLGLSEQLLSSEWSGWWEIATRGFGSGYDLRDFDSERVELSLYEESPEIPAEVEPEIVRTRRGSLFGKQPTRRTARRAPAAVRKAALAGAPSSRRVAAQGAGQARWIDGGFVELATVDALERGGLFLADQITTAGDAVTDRRTALQRRPSLLDGLLVDDRTPALSSALQWAEAVYGQGASGAGLSVNAERVEAMTSVASTSGIDHGRGALQRPVFAFFDAVQGDFLNLESEQASVPTAAASAAPAAPTRRPSLFATTSAPSAGQQRPTTRREARRADAPTITSIDRLVRSSVAAKTAVRPYTEGVFPTMTPRAIRTAPTMVAARPAPVADAVASTTSGASVAPPVTARPVAASAVTGLAAPALQLATQVTYTRGGAPQARIQRASNGAPRASVASASPAGISRALERAAAPAGPAPGIPGQPALSAIAAPASIGTSGAAIAAGRPTLSLPTQAPEWRLAADLGPDMPLGATLAKSEIFGAAASAYAAPQTLVERSAFTPTVARGGEVAEGFGSRAFTAAVDGVVWVAPELGDTLAEETPVEAATSRMPLSAVPRGRAASMVPASVAMELGARAATRTQLESRAAAAAGLTVPVAQSTAYDFETRVSHALQSGVVPTASVAPVSTAFATTTSTPAFVPVLAALDATGQADSARPALARVTPAAMMPLGAGHDIDMTSSAGAPRSVDVSGGLVSRWVEQATQTTTSSAPARFGAGAYARFDAPQEMLNLFDAAAPEADAVEPILTSRAAGRRVAAPQRLATPVTAHSLPTPGATRRAIAAGAPVARPMGASQLGAAVSSAPRPALAGPITTVGMASGARNALRRPVATARESRGIAPLVSVLRQVTAAARASSARVEPALSRRIHEVSESRANALVGGPTEAPVARILEQLSGLGASESRAVMQTLRSAGWTGAELEMLTLSDEGAIDAASADSAPMTHTEAVTRLRGVRRAIEAARVAPMSTEQLSTQMTSGEAASFAAPVVAPELAHTATLTPTAPLATAPTVAEQPHVVSSDVATAARMGRNLARAVSGTEALGAPVTAGQLSPEALSSVASAQAASFMPILANASRDSYFGATAPERTAGRRPQVSGLRDAVGELVAMASEIAAVGDTAVEDGAGPRVLNRLVGSRTRLESRRPAVRASVARVLAAGSNERELVSALARVPVAERHEALALARANAPQIVERIEQAVAAGAVTFESGLADLIAGRELPTIGIDAATADAVPATAVRGLGLGGALDAAYVTPERELAGGDAELGGLGEAGIGGRVTSALRASTRGPAGARRLLQPLSQAAEPRQALLTRAAERKALTRTETTAPTDLASVLAPEAMLGGLRSHEVSRAMSGLDKDRGRTFRGEAPGVFATFADSGVDMASETATVLGDPAVSRRTTRSTMAPGTPSATQPVRSRSLFKSDPVQVLLQLVGRDPAAAQRAFAGGDTGITTRTRAGLFNTIMRGADRREVASLFQQAGASDFAFAWLSRVDGTRSGLDIGLGGARTEMGRAFGSRTTTARMAGESPIHQASFVGPAEGPSRADRSGLRSLAAHAKPGRGGARPSHGASAALRRTDWRFVETGSRAQTAHADLGKLASAIVSSSQAASRAPLPLIAPAAKAVAQTALRSANTEASPGQQSKSSAKPSGSKGTSKQPQAALSEEALEQLAIEMASRVAQIMGRNKERIGVWH